MQYTSAASPWTVQTLTDGATSAGSNLQADGIGCFHSGSKFQMATGQFGAATGSFWAANGGTAPIWSTQACGFTIGRDGRVDLDFIASTNTTAGVGAVRAFLRSPFNRLSSTVGNITFPSNMGVCTVTGLALTDISFQVVLSTGGLTNVNNGTITSSANIEASVRYIADVS